MNSTQQAEADGARRAAIVERVTQHGPHTPRALMAAIGVKPAALTRLLAPLVQSGQIVLSGLSTNRVYGLPGSPAAPPARRQDRESLNAYSRERMRQRRAGLAGEIIPRPNRQKGRPPRPAKPVRSTAERLQAGIDHALNQGASVDAARLRRQLVADVPTVTVDQVTAALEQRWREGIVERIYVTDSQIRYRKLAKVRKMVAAA